MTMAGTAAAAMQEELRRRAREARSAVRRAGWALDDAAALVRLQGMDSWLGPAREAYDARAGELRGRLEREEHELRMLQHALTGLL